MQPHPKFCACVLVFGDDVITVGASIKENVIATPSSPPHSPRSPKRSISVKTIDGSRKARKSESSVTELSSINYNEQRPRLRLDPRSRYLLWKARAQIASNPSVKVPYNPFIQILCLSMPIQFNVVGLWGHKQYTKFLRRYFSTDSKTTVI